MGVRGSRDGPVSDSGEQSNRNERKEETARTAACTSKPRRRRGECAGPASSARVPALVRGVCLGQVPRGAEGGRDGPGWDAWPEWGRGAVQEPAFHRGSRQAVPPAAAASPSPGRRPRDPPPCRVLCAPRRNRPLCPHFSREARRSERRGNFPPNCCSREAVAHRPWPRALPANTPRGRREEGVTEETDEQHQLLLPLSLFLKEQRALFLKGRREFTHTHTHTWHNSSLQNLQFSRGGSSPCTHNYKHTVRFSSETN